ncbi:MAG: hypothetical protein JSW51_14835 [Gemmatimonadota bacterium]|nr:MAG: hypothetical protein JSW51_14835 [Gemmatimonadota bacterium]
MLLNTKAAAITCAVIAGALFLLVGIANMAFPSYGSMLLDLGASIYPGYGGPDGFMSVVVVTLYASVDGLVGGAVVAWLYNAVARGGHASTPKM